MRYRGKVLVVDDDPIVLEITRARLERAGFEVVTRQDAVGTMRAVLDDAPDVVLLDVNMPGLSGEVLTRLITGTQFGRRTSIILHSAKEEEALGRLAQDCGAAGSIPKTPDTARFLLQFEKVLMARRQNQRLAEQRASGSARKGT